MEYVDGVDREQMMMTSLDQLVHPEAFVRIIDAFIDGLDFSSYAFVNEALKRQGRPPYHPGVLMKLYLYGYQHGIRSCRKLEHATKVNIEVMWLLKGRKPHYKTIANFRKDNAKAFRQVFRNFVGVLKEWDLVDGKCIAVDSFKIRAQNSLKNNYNEAKIDRHLAYIDNKINEYLQALDEEEDPIKMDQIEIKKEQQIVRWNKYCDLLDALYQSDEDQISTTDPEAKAVILHRNIVNVGYNVQAVSDAKHKLLVAMDTGSVNDTHALSEMVVRAKENIVVNKTNVLADKGYHTGSEIAKCEALQVITYVSPKANPANKKYNVFPMEDFRYHPPSDTYRCPNDQILRSNKKYYQRKSNKKGRPPVRFKHYKTKACQSCLIKDQCTSSASGRIIQRSEHQSAIDRNNRRVNTNPEYYRQRQQIIEHQFGTLKRQWGFDHVLVRGKQHVLAEVSLAFTAYNLRRSVSILGFSEVLRRLKLTIIDFLPIYAVPHPVKYDMIKYISLLSEAA